MYCLESREEMPALEEEIAEAEAESIPVHNGWGPKELLVENGRIKGVVFKRCTAVYDAEHRFAPQYDEQDTILSLIHICPGESCRPNRLPPAERPKARFPGCRPWCEENDFCPPESAGTSKSS